MGQVEGKNIGWAHFDHDRGHTFVNNRSVHYPFGDLLTTTVIFSFEDAPAAAVAHIARRKAMDEMFEVVEWRIVGWVLDPTNTHCHKAGCDKPPVILLSHWESLEYEVCCKDHEPPGLHDPIAEIFLNAAKRKYEA